MRVRARLRRLRRLSSAELGWRARAGARQAADRITTTLRPPAWHRPALARALTPGAGLGEVRALLAAGRITDAHHGLAAHMRVRPVRFLVHHSMRESVARRVRAACPAADVEARATANRICAGEYDLLGYERLRFDAKTGTVDWHLDPVSGHRAPFVFWTDVPYLDAASGDHKVIWELNRHQHWIALGRAWWLTGDRRYRERAIDEAGSWLAANPPLRGVNWTSALELGFRVMSWTWAIELFAGDDVPGEAPWLVDLLLGLDAQLHHIERNLSWYFSPNTHLLGEALALYVCGRAWPELDGAVRWARLGGDILIDEGDRQVLADGMHAERSPHYHRYALEFYLLALAMARLTGDASREPALAVLADRLATALGHITDGAGRIPLIGDDDGGEVFPLSGHAPDDVRPALAWAAALLDRPELAMGPTPERVLWLMAAFDRPAPPPPQRMPDRRSVVLASSGYHVSRRSDALLVFDAGAHGFMNGGHAHADALAVTLSVAGHRLLMDPGTGTYTMDPALRDRMRSSALHNTVTVDDRSQSVPAGPFQWARAAGAYVRRAVLGATFDLFHAGTDAYLPLVHERFVFATGERSWIVADRIAGGGRHRAAVHWHLDPAWTLSPCGRGAWTLLHTSGLEARLAVCHAALDVFRADETTGLGWVAPVYGPLMPATTIRGAVDRSTPFWIVTTIDTGDPRVAAGSTRLLDPAPDDPDASRCAVMTVGPTQLELTGFRTASEPDPVTLALDERGAVGLTTDAVAFHVRATRDGRLLHVQLVEATSFRFDGSEPVTISCPASVDLDVRLDADGVPTLSSAGPTGQVRVRVERSQRNDSPRAALPARQPVCLE
jgi:hypothetical protein